ncbi:hypothetical protein ETB97_003699 [Aspergillus alliaceus]|uniref:Uncharacterized protein n=1 Tax=Petromyces alliaceus TaxID=209559 RepID=A0A8H6EAI4_PETAA|nr:hypothetical protein ETB97_003699 [Aspergillus burnettii]
MDIWSRDSATIASTASDINSGDNGNRNSIGGFTGRTAIQVILLDIDTILGDIRQGDILVQDILDVTLLTGVGFGSASILATEELGVRKGDPVDGLVTLAADRAYTEPVTTVAVHTVDNNLLDLIPKPSELCAAGVAVTLTVNGITGGVVQSQAGDDEVLGSLNVEAMDRPVLDVEVLNARVVHVLDDDEVVRPKKYDTIAINDVTISTGDGNAGARDNNRIEATIHSITGCL